MEEENTVPQEKEKGQEAKKSDFEAFKHDLNEKIKKKREVVKSKLEPKKLDIKVTKPEKEAKPIVETKKTMAKITPEQMNMLINGISNTVCFVRHTEEVTMDESGVFAKALYDVAEANGWLDDLTFLPYLVLAASGTQLAITIMMKPKKAGYKEKIIEPKKDDIKVQVESKPEVPKGGDYDMINSDELVKKINSV